MSFFRSEKMWFCQIILHKESAFECLVELGYVGKVQFLDVHEYGSQSSNTKYSSEIMRCLELERIIKRFQEHINKSGMRAFFYPNVDEDEKPDVKDLLEIETVLQRLDTELNDVQIHCDALQARKFALFERRQVLLKTQDFLTGARNTEPQIATYDSMMHDLIQDNTNLESGLGKGDRDRARPLSFITGALRIDRFAAFERMIWRVSRGNAHVKYAEFDIPEELAQRHGQSRYKYAFIVVFVGDELRTKITKVCNGFRAKMYPCPETQKQRREDLESIATDLEDLEQIFAKSCEHKRRVLSATVSDLCIWRSKIRKISAVYRVLNQLGTVRELRRKNHKYILGECWVPKKHITHVREALMRGALRASQGDPTMMFPPLFNEHLERPSLKKPTYFHTNKFTAGFQNLIDSYGIATYRELNPAPYTIVTFPFLFAVMFGDIGHGLLLALFAYALIYREDKIKREQITSTKSNEIFNLLFAGRYILLLMGIFSIYTGVIYNDVFSKTMVIFGSSWKVNVTITEVQENHFIQLDPARKDHYRGTPYILGLDPIWNAGAENAIIIGNSLKMKIAIILGVVQMVFGLVLSACNAVYFNSKIDLYLVVLPQMIFMSCLFFYLVLLIFAKWYFYGGLEILVHSAACAPSILIMFINMVLMKGAPPAPEGCNEYMYDGQPIVQRVLLFIALFTVPVLLCGKPLHFMYQHRRIRKMKNAHQQDELRRNTLTKMRKSLIYSVEFSAAEAAAMARKQDEEENLGEIWIHQGIHTIESVLGSVSHTASYLRLWALSLAHSQLSHVLWKMVLSQGLSTDRGYINSIVLFFGFAFFAVLTVAILIVMEGLSAFLHTLRLHWVEFQSKFYGGLGESFSPFRFEPTRKSDENLD